MFTLTRRTTAELYAAIAADFDIHGQTGCRHCDAPILPTDEHRIASTPGGWSPEHVTCPPADLSELGSHCQTMPDPATGAPLISCDYLSFGDYDNSCAVERANVRYCDTEHLTVYKDRESYGWEKAWIADTAENRELLNALVDYPCLDDKLVSVIESEIEDEYIKDNDDIWRATPEPLRSILDDLDLRCIDPETYFAAKEADNAEFIVEAGGVGYIDLDRLRATYNLLLCDKYPAIRIIADLREQLDRTTVPFPLDYYADAADMLTHRELNGQPYTQEEARAILQYAAELEEKGE